MEAWIHFNESVRNPVFILCVLKKNLGRCMFLTLTPISLGLRSSPTVGRQSMNILMSLSALHFLLTFFIAAVSVCCMLPRLSCLLTCHNDVIDAEQNNRLYAPQVLIWIGLFFVYHTCKTVRITYKYVIILVIILLEIKGAVVAVIVW